MKENVHGIKMRDVIAAGRAVGEVERRARIARGIRVVLLSFMYAMGVLDEFLYLFYKEFKSLAHVDGMVKYLATVHTDDYIDKQQMLLLIPK